MSCRTIFAGLLALLAAMVTSRASACDRAALALVVPQTAIVSPLVVLPQVVAGSPVVVQTPAVVAVPQVNRVKVIQPRRARTIIRTRSVIR